METALIIFTDGACINNGKKNAKGGIGVYFPGGEFDNISHEFINKTVTNQRAELYAIYMALQQVINNNKKYNKIIIYSDSLYSIRSLTLWIKQWEQNGWYTTNKKPVQNLDIIQPIYNILTNKQHTIEFKHVRSHTKENTFEAIGNDKADHLACNGIKKLKK